MDRQRAQYILGDLDRISLHNLQCGRITRDAMSRAVRRARNNPRFVLYELGRFPVFPSESDMILAECLNDLFDAARFVAQKKA